LSPGWAASWGLAVWLAKDCRWLLSISVLEASMYDGADAGLVLEGEQDVVPALSERAPHMRRRAWKRPGSKASPASMVAPVLG